MLLITTYVLGFFVCYAICLYTDIKSSIKNDTEDVFFRCILGALWPMLFCGNVFYFVFRIIDKNLLKLFKKYESRKWKKENDSIWKNKPFKTDLTKT